MVLDHLILNVNDAAESAKFYTDVFGWPDEGNDGPFTVVRVTPDFTLLLSPGGTEGGEHLAFAMPRAEFDAVFSRIRERRIPYGGAFDSVGSMSGPGEDTGARGLAPTVYLFDPNRHLFEIRTYEP